MRRTPLLLTIVLALGLVGIGATAASAGTTGGTSVDLGHQVLPANDGWASSGTGTTGGSLADAAHVFTVHNRQELIAALGGDNVTNRTNATPKIIYVRGTIDGSVDDAGQPLGCDDFADPEYSLDAYLVQYDPATWGRVVTSGPLEDARARSQRNQTARIQINVGPNTTIVGLGLHAGFVGTNLVVSAVDNVILRNFAVEAPLDCFPRWDPTDGANGNWNSSQDAVSLLGATHVWVDHITVSDGDHPDSEQPVYFGRPFQGHDGALDITRGADLVTVSWSVFRDHDKSLLIGASDTATTDPGKLRVTLHHNLFSNLIQRAPRVRFGQVHVYDNMYVIPSGSDYSYSWGVGVQSAIYAESNFFLAGAGVEPADFMHDWGGTAIHATSTLVNGVTPRDEVDVLAAYNAAHDPDFSGDVGWTPTLHTRIDPPQLVPFLVPLAAGAGHLLG
jgi:pectate lyase